MYKQMKATWGCFEIRDPQLPAFPSSQTLQHKETYIHNVAQFHSSLRHLADFRFLYQRYSEVHKTTKDLVE